MKKQFIQLKDAVIDQGLCTRCGICIGVCPVAALDAGAQNYPNLTGKCVACGLCSDCCPGADVDFPALSREMGTARATGYDDLQGYVENTYVAHALDKDTRHSGASGGLITALLLYLLEKGRIDGAALVGADQDAPYRSKGILACSPEEIRACAQSKYCVTPSMDVLREIRQKEGRFAVVALPCQIHGLKKLALADPKLYRKIEVIFGLYCSCTMEPNGHIEAMEAVGIKRDEVAAFEFRGGGWPGGMFVYKKDKSTVSLHPAQAYGTVVNVMFRLFGCHRCHLCIDGLAQFADLSFGDFWAFDYAGELNTLECCTLVSQRSKKGLQILMDAEKDGAIIRHLLPEDRVSKRTLFMVRGKRSRAGFLMAKRRKNGQSNPDYHFAFLEPEGKAWKKNISYTILGWLRSTAGRKIILRILFSPLIPFLHKLNRLRMRMFVHYHDN